MSTSSAAGSRSSAGKIGATLEWTREAEAEAILWSQKKGDRSGRIAYQFACDWVGRTAMQGRRT